MAQRDLLINVDDIGIHEGAVEAAVETISNGVAASGSVMTVCHGTQAALELLASRPEVPVGVHLTLTRDFPEWTWSPLTDGASLQDAGLLPTIADLDQLMARADLDEVKAEFRAQIEAAVDAGLRPTHLDWHCLVDGGREDIFDVTLALADEYQLGIRAWTDRGRSAVSDRGRTPQDQPFLDSFTVPIERKEERLLEQIRAVPTGLTEWAMHPALPSPTDPGSEVRSTDRDALLAPSIHRALQEEAIRILGHGDPRLLPGR